VAEIDWKPSVAEVASYIRARTKIAGGGIAGTFTDQTNVKASEVEPLIDQAVRRVTSEIGASPCTEDLTSDATTAAALYAAMLVEQSFFPEQTTGVGNSFASLEKLFKPQLQTLANRVQQECGTGSGGEDGADGSAIARATFDDRELLGPNSREW
jgi:hypothetical protein